MDSCVLMRQQKLFLRMYLDVYCKLNFNIASFSSFLLYLFVYLKQFQVLKENSFRNQHKTDMLDFYFCLECVPNITFLCQVYNLCFNQESSISQVFVSFGIKENRGKCCLACLSKSYISSKISMYLKSIVKTILSRFK